MPHPAVTPMILIVSHERNAHVDEVRRHLSAEPVLGDTGWFPASLRVHARFGQQEECFSLGLPDGRPVPLCRVGAVWHRRISPLGLHEDLTDQTARLFAWSEANEALQGLWYSLGCFWMNPPTADEVSQRKIRQLQVARRLGFSIPETLITNDPEAARAFVERHRGDGVIRKAFRNIPQAPRTTALVREEDLAVIDTVRYAPVIFQRFVPAEVDLRVTIVEEEIFAAA